VELLKYLLELRPSALHQKDSYGRYPIHVLCDSGRMTLSAVQLLLVGEGKSHILEPTKYLGVSLAWQFIL
jgi:ankyrin repeat protein